MRRRKLKKSYEYEVRWAGAFSHPEHDTWLTRDQCAPGPHALPRHGLQTKHFSDFIIMLQCDNN